jgi:hypothetical protein
MADASGHQTSIPGRIFQIDLSIRMANNCTLRFNRHGHYQNVANA